MPEAVIPSAHRARKRFGQNFLHDSHVIDRIVAAIQPNENVPLIEIGPGHGAITGPLLRAQPNLTAIEIDRDLARELRQRFPTLRLIEQDVLECRLRDIVASDNGARGARVKVVGNLPYNISTPLIFHLLQDAAYIDRMYFMLQREVVERLAADPGGKDYGRLSVIVQFHCEVVPLFDIPPGAFRPVPRVDSTLVMLKPRPFPMTLDDPAHFASLVAAAFQQRRKTLRNALRGMLPNAVPAAIAPHLSARAETLTVEQFVEMSNLLSAAEKQA